MTKKKNEKYNQKLQQMQQKMVIGVNGTTFPHKHISQKERIIESEIAIAAQVGAIREVISYCIDMSIISEDEVLPEIEKFLVQEGFLPEK